MKPQLSNQPRLLPSTRLLPLPPLLISPTPRHVPLYRFPRWSIRIGHRYRALDGPQLPPSPRQNFQTLSVLQRSRFLRRTEVLCLKAKSLRFRSRFLRCMPRRCLRFQISTARLRSRSRLSSRFRVSMLIFQTPPNRPSQTRLPL